LPICLGRQHKQLKTTQFTRVSQALAVKLIFPAALAVTRHSRDNPVPFWLQMGYIIFILAHSILIIKLKDKPNCIFGLNDEKAKAVLERE
jgi:hypothetical protein